MAETYIIPAGYQGKKELLWINFIARDFEEQNSYARGQNAIQTGSDILGTWRLLAPTEIQESISHDYGEYESIGTRVAQKIGDLKTLAKEYGALKNAFNTTINAITEGIKSRNEGGKSYNAKDIVSSVAGAAATSNIPKYKIDTSMTYQDSKRREYTMTFHFAITPGDKGGRQSVFEPIRKLEELSCAQLDQGLINIKFPAVFRIYTKPGNIININHAVLTAVQPTWKAPYDAEGYPYSCELQLTFMDISPLYRRSFKKGGIVSVIPTDYKHTMNL